MQDYDRLGYAELSKREVTQDSIAALEFHHSEAEQVKAWLDWWRDTDV